MATGKRPVAKSRRLTARDRQSEDVNEFMRTLDHPQKAEIDALRWIILGAGTSIAEGLKWNAPSFSVGEYFATLHVKSHGCVHVILHQGAKPKASSKAGLKPHDPDGLLQWLGPDRAEVKFRDMADLQAKKRAFTEIVRQWIACL